MLFQFSALCPFQSVSCSVTFSDSLSNCQANSKIIEDHENFVFLFIFPSNITLWSVTDFSFEQAMWVDKILKSNKREQGQVENKLRWSQYFIARKETLKIFKNSKCCISFFDFRPQTVQVLEVNSDAHNVTNPSSELYRNRSRDKSPLKRQQIYTNAGFYLRKKLQGPWHHFEYDRAMLIVTKYGTNGRKFWNFRPPRQPKIGLF